MPARDGTGPLGRGSMTGRGAGYCPDGVPHANLAGRCNGLRSGGGFGAGRRRAFRSIPEGLNYFGAGRLYRCATPEDESGWLQVQAQRLEHSLANVRQCLADLENKSEPV